ncbi:MAG: flagellin [Syntrophus sp. PtaB.Bin138]|nr:MAG: flagellin [Syntrophus sp. PtaB.Bin138]
MSLNGISLTAGMRNNLLSLQNTSASINRTQERLSSGKKVNSPLDNPTNYFAAQSHLQRGEDLSARKDGMSEAIQMIKAADTGIKAITSLIESAKGVVQAALATSSPTDRTAYSTTFDTLLTQISQLASDSGYRGTNFLTSGSQTVEFGQTTGVSTLAISGFDATSSGLGLSKTTTATITTINNNPAPDATENVSAFLSSWNIGADTGPNTPFTFTSDLFHTIYDDRTLYRLVDTTRGGFGTISSNYG